MATQAYFVQDGSGDFWQCAAGTSAGQSPATHPAKWVKMAIPETFASYLVHRAAAVLMTGEGQSDKAVVEDSIARKKLELVTYQDRLERGGLNRPNVFTR